MLFCGADVCVTVIVAVNVVNCTATVIVHSAQHLTQSKKCASTVFGYGISVRYIRCLVCYGCNNCQLLSCALVALGSE